MICLLLMFTLRKMEIGDVSWVSFTDLRGTGLFVAGAPELNFRVHRYTIEDLEKARHLNELNPRDEITINLDYRHQSINSASCGPECLDKYRLNPENFNFSLRFRPYTKDLISPVILGREDF